MRICLVYDCLYPYTVGGAERWYRNLAERLAQEGHEVAYLTLRQWERGTRVDLDERVRVVTAGPHMGLYTEDGAGGSPRRWCSGWGCCGTCCATAAATRWCTPAPLPLLLAAGGRAGAAPGGVWAGGGLA